MLLAFSDTLQAMPHAPGVVLSLALMLFGGFAMTRLTKLVRLPNVTAYILIGILMGPDCLALIPGQIIQRTDFLADIALALIAFGALIAYENIIMNLLNDVLWRWGRDSVVFRAFYLVMDQLPDVMLCVALILCGAWLVRGPQKAGKKQAEAQEDAARDADFQEYHAQPDAPEMTLSDDASAKEENGHDE